MDFFIESLKKGFFKVKYYTHVEEEWSYKEYLTNILRLNCSNKDLTYIPDLPMCKILHCNNNKLTALPNLPKCKELICNDNNITCIPKLPKCRILICFNNPLIEVPTSPLIPSCTMLKYNNDIKFREKSWEIEKPGFNTLHKKYNVVAPDKISSKELRSYFEKYISKSHGELPLNWLLLIAEEYTFYQKSSYPYLSKELVLATIVFCDKLLNDKCLKISSVFNIVCNHVISIIEHEIMEMYFVNEKLSLLSNIKNFLDLK